MHSWKRHFIITRKMCWSQVERLGHLSNSVTVSDNTVNIYFSNLNRSKLAQMELTHLNWWDWLLWVKVKTFCENFKPFHLWKKKCKIKKKVK